MKDILFVVSQEAKGARGSRSNQLEGKVTMVIALRKNEVEGAVFLRKSKSRAKWMRGGM